jgi:hypothetical protein
MAKKYKDYDLSTPEKRGYAVRKAEFDTITGEYQDNKSNSLGNNMHNTGPERNIGPRMDSESIKNRKTLPGESATTSKKREGKWQAGFDKAKAETENMGPEYKKGGKIKSDMSQDKAMIKKAVKMHDEQMHGGKKTNMKALKQGGCASMRTGGYVTAADGCATKGKTKGRFV